jgi:hypothetical protein
VDCFFKVLQYRGWNVIALSQCATRPVVVLNLPEVF